jgi:hypothetical protein
LLACRGCRNKSEEEELGLLSPICSVVDVCCGSGGGGVKGEEGIVLDEVASGETGVPPVEKVEKSSMSVTISQQLRHHLVLLCEAIEVGYGQWKLQVVQCSTRLARLPTAKDTVPRLSRLGR